MCGIRAGDSDPCDPPPFPLSLIHSAEWWHRCAQCVLEAQPGTATEVAQRGTGGRGFLGKGHQKPSREGCVGLHGVSRAEAGSSSC